jgi:hypothetical protein
VSEPVTATPSQPSTGDSNANAPPAAAIHVPSVIVWPDRFITNASASTTITVTIANRSWTSVAPYALSARGTDNFSTIIVRTPARSIWVPGVVSTFSVNSVSDTAFPLGLTTCSPGQWNLTVALSSRFLTAVI